MKENKEDIFINYRNKTLEEIYFNEKDEKESKFLTLLRILPFEVGYSRRDISRLPTEDKNLLQSWGRQCCEFFEENKGSIEEATVRQKIFYYIKTLYHLEMYMEDIDFIEQLDDVFKELLEKILYIGENIEDKEFTDFSRYLGGLICILLTRVERTYDNINKTFEWIIYNYLKSTKIYSKKEKYANDMILRSLITFSQGLPVNFQNKLLLALGVDIKNIDPEEKRIWFKKIIKNPKITLGTKEIIEEASTALGRMIEWSNSYSKIQDENIDLLNIDIKKRPLVISLHSHKGGVGKTIMTLSLGIKLARSGYKVRIIDTDFMASSWVLFLKYKDFNYQEFIPIENFIHAFIKKDILRKPELDKMWRKMWNQPEIGKIKGELKVSFTSPLAHKRTKLIGKLYTKNYYDITRAYIEIIKKAKKDNVDCILFDNHAGLWGFSFVSLRQTILDKGLAIFISHPDMHDITGSLLELAAIRDLAFSSPGHYIWLINRVMNPEYYNTPAIAKRLVENPAFGLFENPDLAYRLIESKFWIVDVPIIIEEKPFVKRAFIYKNVVDLDKIYEFLEEGDFLNIYESCVNLLKQKKMGKGH